MFKLFSNLLFAPEVPDGKSIGNTGVVDSPKGTSKEDIIDFLKDDDEEEPIKIEDDKKKDAKDKKEVDEESEEDDEKDTEEDEDDEEDDDEIDELTELEDELEEPDEEKLELVTPVRRKEILAKYPKLFKDFPYLEKAYYREQQYTELLPTIDDAKQAVEDQKILQNFEGDLDKGNTETILQAIKNNAPKSFAKLVDNYLGTLAKVDEKAYHHVLGNVIKHTIIQMAQEARSSDNEALQSAAQILNQFVFGSSNFTQPTKLSSDEVDKKDDKEEELSSRERAFQEKTFKAANDGIETKVNNRYKKTIEVNIDPKESMSDYVRKNASREAYEQLVDLVAKDNRFKIIVDKLWERAAKDDYSKASLDRIEAAFASKASTLLPSVIKKARNEALRGMGKRVRDDDSEKDEKIEKDTTPSKRRSSEKREEKEQPRSNKSGQKVPAGMSTLDYLMSD